MKMKRLTGKVLEQRLLADPNESAAKFERKVEHVRLVKTARAKEANTLSSDANNEWLRMQKKLRKAGVSRKSKQWKRMEKSYMRRIKNLDKLTGDIEIKRKR